MNTNLTNAQKDYAVFLPAISGFFATFVGKQRYEEYVEKSRIPKIVIRAWKLRGLKRSKLKYISHASKCMDQFGVKVSVYLAAQS